MDNMHWDENTRTWLGQAQPLPVEPEPPIVTGWSKPLPVAIDTLPSDDATEVFYGVAQPYPVSLEDHAELGYSKPLLVTAQWMQEEHDRTLLQQPNALQVLDEAAKGDLSEKWLMAQGLSEIAAQQLVQAMAGFAQDGAFALPGAAQQQQPWGQTTQLQATLSVADGSHWA